MRRMNRRKFLSGAFVALPVLAGANAFVEPIWIRTRHLRIGTAITHRIVQFTDLHYRGNKDHLKRVVRKINALSPDLVCFTGDLIEDKEMVGEALEILAGLNSPLLGVPGNHDYWADASFPELAAGFQKTGGAWLMDEQFTSGDLVVTGASCESLNREIPAPASGKKNLLLMHYPAWVEHLKHRYDLVLAGHSHGGQVRLPFLGAPILPFYVEQYDLGLFDTKAGSLYVNPGLGWFAIPVRFGCRPELTVIEI